MKKYYILAVFIIITGLVLGFNILNKKFGFIQTEETAQRIYKQGLDDIEAGNLQNAYYNFSKISKFNSYYEPALFRQGLLATELNDNGSAVKAYETLLEKFPNTFFAEKSIYNLAVAYYNSSFKEIAEKLSARSGVPIMVLGDQLREERYFASFINGESVYDILNALNFKHQFHITKTEDAIIVSPANPIKH